MVVADGKISPKKEAWQTIRLPKGTGNVRLTATGSVTSYGQTSGPTGLSSEPDFPNNVALKYPNFPRLALLVRACKGYGPRDGPSPCTEPQAFKDTSLVLDWILLRNADHLELTVNNVDEAMWGKVTDWYSASDGEFIVTAERIPSR